MFEQLCSELLVNDEHTANPSRTVDRLFSSENACTTYKNLRNFEGGPFDEKIDSILTRLDAIVTGGVDNLPQAIEDTEIIAQQRMQEEGAADNNATEKDTRSVERMCVKAGNLLRRSAERLKYILPLVSEQLFKHSHDILVRPSLEKL